MIVRQDFIALKMMLITHKYYLAQLYVRQESIVDLGRQPLLVVQQEHIALKQDYRQSQNVKTVQPVIIVQEVYQLLMVNAQQDIIVQERRRQQILLTQLQEMFAQLETIDQQELINRLNVREEQLMI